MQQKRLDLRVRSVNEDRNEFINDELGVDAIVLATAEFWNKREEQRTQVSHTS